MCVFSLLFMTVISIMRGGAQNSKQITARDYLVLSFLYHMLKLHNLWAACASNAIKSHDYWKYG